MPFFCISNLFFRKDQENLQIIQKQQSPKLSTHQKISSSDKGKYMKNEDDFWYGGQNERNGLKRFDLINL